jgi:DNA adenine methylase
LVKLQDCENFPDEEQAPLILLPQPIERPAGRWFGGKWLLGRWIASHFPAHQTYVEPFGGLFSVGLQKLPSVKEIYNDLHEGACNFLGRLRDNPELLIPLIEETQFDKEMFELSLETAGDLIEAARRFYAHCLLAYTGGGISSGSTSAARLALVSSQKKDYSHLWAIAGRIKNLQILKRDAMEVIREYDSPTTLFYLDPCYLPETRNSHTPYVHEMTKEQHIHLAQLLHSIQGMAVVSGYPSELYNQLYSDWQRFEKEAITTSKKRAIECLWISPNTSSSLGATPLCGIQLGDPPEWEDALADTMASTEEPSRAPTVELDNHLVNTTNPSAQDGYLELNLICTDGGTQSRARLDDQTIGEYAEAMDAGVAFPSVLVFYDGESYWLADGFHRVAAAKRLEWTDIAVEIRAGHRRDAVLYSVGTNATHGLRRTNADKHRAVETLLRDEEWSQWSDREIARRCGVSNDFVSRLRKSICHRMTDSNRMVQRKGKMYSLDTTRIGSKTTSDCQVQSELITSTAIGLKERDRVVVADSHPVLAGQRGTITGRPSTDAAIVALDEGERERILIRQLQPEELRAQDLVSEPKSKDKQLLPDVERNGDTPPSSEPPAPAALVNGSAIAHGKPDVVAAEIAIGVKHLTSQGLLHVMEAIAHHIGADALGNLLIESIYKDEIADLCNKCLDAMDKRAFSWLEVEKINFSGLTEAALKLLIKESKQSLNERHHPEYFNKPVVDRRGTHYKKDAHKGQMVDWDEDTDDEDLALGIPEGDEEAS